MDCIFCTNPDIKQRMIYQNELVMVFPTNIPIVPGHLLICPVRCVSVLDDLNENEWLAIKKMIAQLKPVLTKVFEAEGFNYAWNEGDLAGQSVKHLHVHMLPRKTGDAGILKYEPREFIYRPGSREPSPKQELDNIVKLIKEQF